MADEFPWAWYWASIVVLVVVGSIRFRTAPVHVPSSSRLTTEHIGVAAGGLNRAVSTTLAELWVNDALRVDTQLHVTPEPGATPLQQSVKQVLRRGTAGHVVSDLGIRIHARDVEREAITLGLSAASVRTGHGWWVALAALWLIGSWQAVVGIGDDDIVPLVVTGQLLTITLVPVLWRSARTSRFKEWVTTEFRPDRSGHTLVGAGAALAVAVGAATLVDLDPAFAAHPELQALNSPAGDGGDAGSGGSDGGSDGGGCGGCGG